MACRNHLTVLGAVAFFLAVAGLGSCGGGDAAPGSDRPTTPGDEESDGGSDGLGGSATGADANGGDGGEDGDPATGGAGATSPSCLETGAACEDAEDCCTGRCDFGLCLGTTGLCSANGEACAASAECCSGRCESLARSSVAWPAPPAARRVRSAPRTPTAAAGCVVRTGFARA